MKILYYSLVFAGALIVANPLASTSDFGKAKENILMRRIGHELLLSAGDSTSRVLPIKKDGDGKFQIPFEKPFSFMPDSLVGLVTRVMKSSKFSDEYAVNVVNTNNGEVDYAFSIAGGSSDEVPCIGRKLPVGNYRVDILMKSPGLLSGIFTSNRLMILLLALLAGASIFLFRRSPRGAVQAVALATNGINIGNYLFYPSENRLTYAGEQTILTSKESKLLEIFCLNINHVIERTQLLKEGWEDEGVITTRSLDVFVSRLRKKLQKDPTVQIKNVHGRGYALATSS